MPHNRAMIAALENPALDTWIDRAMHGEDVVLTRNGQVVCKLVPTTEPESEPVDRLAEIVAYTKAHGLRRDIELPPDFDAPMTDIWAALR
jgi:antitoxin (DNA-binding transcriptional repressor) of toxin-antitoxin stability system